MGGFCPKIEAIINSIPTSVMGGVSLLLFGLIASNGLRMLVSNRVDFSKARNLMLVSAILVVGVGMETAGVKIPRGRLRDSRHGHKRHRGRDFESLPAQRHCGR